MKAIKDKNNIIIRNAEQHAEDAVFNEIVTALEKNKSISVKKKIEGPSEDVVIAECRGNEFTLIYDIDYGIEPIECTVNNVDVVFDIIQQILNN